ncbi:MULTISPECIES: TetR/AcrR family transcriptional regulator C-terminal domain-containing protein [Amycolatopsis]|uniref:TetR/AcrR family transcriptional regulator C-terminal domain-containing protein n=1 Tax=Amycolatopsis thermalba TaxID=944492 RepID=A0ABY4P3Q5_9PSEU|nr:MULTISPECIES: TetR/AcrR family transcriptional regulator C-terminal domain-containing protein [Amycolatopsis]UQS26985.1 TetR/AcrR family transcriptional regulator C-terminal domain-containing protein [Amycolatopsis thermalba]
MTAQGWHYPWPEHATGEGRLDRAGIVRAALELLDTDGVEQFSTRKLAARLGIKSPSLYWHVKGKEELFALVVDHVVGECRLPSRRAGWRQQLEDIGHGLRSALVTHPAAPRLLLGQPLFGPNGLRLADHVIGALRDHGFGDRLASHGYIVFLNYVVGFAIQETAFGKGPGGRERLDQVDAFLAGLPADQYPDLVAVAGELTAGRFTSRFDLGLGAILDRLDTEREAG